MTEEAGTSESYNFVRFLCDCAKIAEKIALIFGIVARLVVAFLCSKSVWVCLQKWAYFSKLGTCVFISILHSWLALSAVQRSSRCLSILPIVLGFNVVVFLCQIVICHVKAYSLRDKDVGYCQGSGFIVGLLLMHVSTQYSLVMGCCRTVWVVHIHYSVLMCSCETFPQILEFLLLHWWLVVFTVMSATTWPA